MPNKERLTTITLTEIAKTQKFGEVSFGANLSTIGSYLGRPTFWNFDPNNEFFSAWMYFGEVEIGFKAYDNIVKVEYAKFYLNAFENGSLKFCKPDKKTRLLIKNDWGHDSPSFSLVEKKLKLARVQFQTKLVNFVEDETWLVMSFGQHLKFYFALRKSKTQGSAKLQFIELAR